MLNDPLLKQSPTSRRRLARCAAAVIAVGLGAMAAACGDSTSPSNKQFDGVYGLTTVNGQALPFTFDSTASSKIQLVSATISVVTGSGGTKLVETEEDQVFVPGQPTVTNSSSDTETVTVDANGQFSNAQLAGSFTASSLTVNAGGSLFVFQKAAVDPP